jgi:hypothetical protein
LQSGKKWNLKFAVGETQNRCDILNCTRYETIRFFCNQDRLVPFADLDLTGERFVFLRENQNNWTCSAQMQSDQVYFIDRVFDGADGYLAQDIETVLTSFALQEMMFNFAQYIGLQADTAREALHVVQHHQLLYADKGYLNAIDIEYYQVDESLHLMQGGMLVLAGHDAEKLDFYAQKLEHYKFG